MLVTLQTVDVVWLLLAIGFFIALCVYKLPLKLPGGLETLFQDLIRYGKTKKQIKRPQILYFFDVPKRWFWHFYGVSVLWNGFLLHLSFRSVFLHQPLPEPLCYLLSVLTGKPEEDCREPQLTVVVVQVLLWIHSLRRLLECLFVSIFSNATIHVVQYSFGLGYYILLGLTVLCIHVSSPTEGLSEESAVPFHSDFIWLIAGTLLFIWASLLQHRSLTLLATMRTSSSGKVETLSHKMPCGGWFELVSCPHYLAELLIYTSLSICCGCGSLTWWIVVLYVLCNQALAAQLCHDYYINTFKAYPSKRRAFIPYFL